ncbi:MAG: glycosyltransferase family 4 protein [Thalassolituus sp.]|uniref:glycosyltransferase family 4 protein n=1 Tax=Thalassolituus sp. TaxID=2030822 RepID=UPI003982C25C
MKVLLINAFDKLPGESFRDQRYTVLFKKFKEKANVEWWSANFHHWSHSKRSRNELEISGVSLINVPSYKNNISIIRFLSHFIFSLKVFLRLLHLRSRPNVILAIAPVEGLFFIAIYCRIFKVKFIVDVLDLWPDLFIEAFPLKVRWFGKILLMPMHWMANYAYRHADHITSVSKTYTRIAVERSGIKDKPSSYYYLGSPVSECVLVTKSSTILKCLFAGQFEYNYDVETILQAAKVCHDSNKKIEFFLAGSGSKASFMKEYIDRHGLSNVHLVGWLGTDELNHLASECHVGLNSYKGHATQSIPTKYFDYLSMGLVVFNSLDGEMSELIADDVSGLNYISESKESLLTLLDDANRKHDEYSKWGEKNRKLFLRKYSFDAIYESMVDQVLNVDIAI